MIRYYVQPQIKRSKIRGIHESVDAKGKAFYPKTTTINKKVGSAGGCDAGFVLCPYRLPLLYRPSSYRSKLIYGRNGLCQ